jgi:hypothetical protein
VARTGCTSHLAYFAHCSGGNSVTHFDATGIEEVGRFIDESGNPRAGGHLVDPKRHPRQAARTAVTSSVVQPAG